MRGTLVGHSGWVTSLATSLEKYAARNECQGHELELSLLQPKHATLWKS